MKSLSIKILELVRSQPAHRLPVVFTPAECPLPDCSESPEEGFQEALKLRKEGFIEAQVIRDMKSNLKGLEVRYVTLAGALHLETKGTKAREASHSGKASSAVSG